MIEVGSASGHLVVGVLWVMGLLVAVVELRVPAARRVAAGLALAAIGIAAVLAGLLWPGDADLLLAGGGLKLDGFALFVQAFVLVGAMFSLLLGRHLGERWQAGSNGLLLLSAAGVALVAMAVDLVALVAGFVAAVLPLLGLAAIRRNQIGREGALKGMVLCALGTSLLGLGTALMASRTGTTSFEGLRAFFEQGPWVGSDPMLVVAMALVLSGLGLFLAVVPFHMLFTDLADGLPAPAALLLVGGLLATGLAACGRVVLVAFGPVNSTGPGYLSWSEVLHTAGLLAMLIGNSVALVQRKLKRLLTSLAVGQAGLVLLALAAAGQLDETQAADRGRAVAGLLVFLAVHAINWVGLFLALAAVEGESQRPGVASLQGLARRHPWLASAIGLALLCMAGMPLTAGFFARLYLLDSMVVAGWIGTAVAVALSLGLVLVMTLGLVVAMFMRPARDDVQIHSSGWLTLIAWLASLVILLLGILPGGFLELALRSAESLTGL